MSGKCTKCKDEIDKFAPDNSSLIAHYQQCRSVDNCMEVNITGTVEECFLELKAQVRPFLLHIHVKRKQSASFKSLVEECDGSSVVLQVGFSENATIARREIQSAHWNHGQATLFKVHAWIRHYGSDTCSIVIVSDDLNHTKHSVYIFMQ